MTEIADPEIWGQYGGVLGLVIMGLFVLIGAIIGVLVKVTMWFIGELKSTRKENSHNAQKLAGALHDISLELKYRKPLVGPPLTDG